MTPERVRAFAPGRVNLIGEHTDYNEGLALPFAIVEGVTVRAGASDDGLFHVRAADLGEDDDFAPDPRSPAAGWRAFARGVVAELRAAGLPAPAARLQIDGELPRGGGLSSSAALEVALCLALLGLAGRTVATIDRTELARLCARVENDWVGAETGLLDQLASLYGQADTALRIDFRTLRIDPVPMHLDGWRPVVLDSGERHAHAGSGYNERRAECARACRLLGIGSLRDAEAAAVETLPEPLRDRARHVLGENARVEQAVGALRARELERIGELLNASHASLRDLYAVSTAAVEHARAQLLEAGAAGARVIGGGFGGCVLGLFAPGTAPPPQARPVRPAAGARLIG